VETCGNPETAKTWIIALHGYGQLSEYFVKKFSVVCSEDLAVIAPEGPHRFYKEGLSGRVGASWMTKRNRELDIEDNHRYLDEVTNSFLIKGNPQNILVLGFSQGAATACRWLAQTHHPINHLILWSSMFPPDLNHRDLPDKLDIHLVYGQADPFLNQQWKEQYEAWKKRLPHFNSWTFEGGHDIHANKLNEVVNGILTR
jgi:predicted esterase